MSSSKQYKFDLDYIRQVIQSEADAVKSMADIVDDTFSTALDMLYNCSGSVIVSGIGKAGIIAQKISATLASTGTPSCTPPAKNRLSIKTNRAHSDRNSSISFLSSCEGLSAFLLSTMSKYD